MPIQGERFIIAATLDAVEVGKEFVQLPPHMTIVRWFSIGQQQRHFVEHAMSTLFKSTTYQNTTGGRHSLFGSERNIPVREMLGVDSAAGIGLRALVKSLGEVPKDDLFFDEIAPHVSDTEERSIGRGEEVAFSTVALFSKEDDRAHRVEIAKALISEEARS